MNKRVGYLMVAVSAVAYGCVTSFVKVALSYGSNIVTIGSIRFLLASAILWLLLVAQKMPARVGAGSFVALMLAGALGFAGTSATYFLAVETIPISLAVLFVYIYPILVTLGSALIEKERPGLQKIAAMLVAFIGLAVLLNVSVQGAGTKGVLFSLASAFIYTVYIIFTSRLVKGIEPLVAATYVCTAAAFSFTAYGLSSGSLIIDLPPRAWLIICIFALFATVLPMFLFFKGMKLIGPSSTAIVSNIEPVATVILGIVIFSERFSAYQFLGAILVSGGIALLQYNRPGLAKQTG
ncbi:MAG: DMT family transporter [Eubacteriales bacterium]